MGCFQAAEDICLNGLEFLHTYTGNDLLQTTLLPGLKQEVRVDKMIAESLCQEHTYSAFPGSRHADQDDIQGAICPHNCIVKVLCLADF
jgi:hypothetical protein